MSTVHTSVAICTQNRSQTLKRCLDSLSSQTMPADSWELVLTDDRSTDDTLEVCRAYAATAPFSVQVLSMDPASSGLAEARDTALRTCRGEVVLWIDDDCLAAPDWVERMRAGLESHEFVAGRIESPRRPYMKLAHNVAEFHPFMSDQEGPIRFVAGANMGFRKDRVLEIGGFLPQSSLVEDMDLVLRYAASGGEAYYLSDAVVTHDHARARLRELTTYSYTHAQKTVRLRTEYPDLTATPSFLLSPLALRALSVPIAIWSTLRMFARRHGVGRHSEVAPVVFLTKIAWCLGAARGLERSPHTA